jgi:hypothetical protein
MATFLGQRPFGGVHVLGEDIQAEEPWSKGTAVIGLVFYVYAEAIHA